MQKIFYTVGPGFVGRVRAESLKKVLGRIRGQNSEL